MKMDRISYQVKARWPWLRPAGPVLQTLLFTAGKAHAKSAVVLALALAGNLPGAESPFPSNARKPANHAEERYWIENMVRYHHFTVDEVASATGFSSAEVQAKIRLFGLENATVSVLRTGDPLRVLPYPGGRHPRIGFLEGAVDPQRETKFSVFTPWDPASYVVADVPEAIFSNLGLTYLAHTHIPTIWTTSGIALPRLEWNRQRDGRLESERTLPNGIAFGAMIVPAPDGVRMSLWLKNGTAQPLTDIRVQTCVMLKGATGFASLTNANKVFSAPYAAAHDLSGKRWIINAWAPCDRTWGNAKVPCLHSDPRFPDCAPGATVRLAGWLSFYEGPDIQSEFHRLEKIHWRPSLPHGEKADRQR
jgi:hypothetical protein